MAIRDHFDHLDFDGGPMVDGHLADFVDDPTYGDHNIYEGKPLYKCKTCGVAVLDPSLHAGWHDGLTP